MPAAQVVATCASYWVVAVKLLRARLLVDAVRLVQVVLPIVR